MNLLSPKPRELPFGVSFGGVELEGDLVIPSGAEGLVIFAHGSGSSRRSVRNRFVAGEMHRKHLATLLFDLLTEPETAQDEVTGALRFNIPFLADRLVAATRWAMEHESLRGLEFGYFGSSTGAAAALIAAAKVPQIKAVVSRGGRTDLAGPFVREVKAATLLVVGEIDYPVLQWNQQTLEQLPGLKQLSVIPGASHLFPEPDALEQVAELASSWFALHLSHSKPAVM